MTGKELGSPRYWLPLPLWWGGGLISAMPPLLVEQGKEPGLPQHEDVKVLGTQHRGGGSGSSSATCQRELSQVPSGGLSFLAHMLENDTGVYFEDKMIKE